MTETTTPSTEMHANIKTVHHPVPFLYTERHFVKKGRPVPVFKIVTIMLAVFPDPGDFSLGNIYAVGHPIKKNGEPSARHQNVYLTWDDLPEESRQQIREEYAKLIGQIPSWTEPE